MKRNIEKLSTKTYDLLIIGGGIYGAWAAWDAALRGLSVALVEKNDFAGATSANSLKIIHGGLRYLQHADIKRMRESIHERMVLMRVAPHLVHPLPCIMPTYGHGLKGKELMSIALFLNDAVGFDRNGLQDPQKRMPAGRVISRKQTLQILPGIDESGLTGGAIWYDCQIHNSERLLLALLHGASEHGAEIANYAPAIRFLKEGNKIYGVQVQDSLSGKNADIRARMVLNTSGPWVNSVLGQLGDPVASRNFKFSKAMNLVVNRKLIDKYGVGVPSKYEFKDEDALINKGSRLLFMTPWRKYTLIGTTHVPYDGDPNDFAITEKDVQEFLDEFNQAYPALGVKRDEVIFFYGGLLPMDPTANKNGHVTLTKQYHLIDHAKEDGISSLVTVLGVKYTTARDVAEKSIDLVVEKLRQRTKGRTEIEIVPGGNITRFGEFLGEEITKRPWGLEAEVVEHMVYNYGTRYPHVLNVIDEEIALRERLDPAQEVLAAEAVYSVREEMALTLADVVRRRTELGAAGCPPAAALEKTARLLARELGWDEAKISEEIEATRALYQTQPN